MDKKKSKNVLLVIMGVLIIVAIIARILKIQTKPVSTSLYLLSLVFTALYGFCLYKKPHGNILKYAMLIFLLTTIIQACNTMALKGTINHTMVRVIASVAVCYCAGRLNRIDQNKYIMPIIALLFFGESTYRIVGDIIDKSVNLASSVRHFSYTFNYITLMIAYFVRYKEHKEAGLIDAPKE